MDRERSTDWNGWWLPLCALTRQAGGHQVLCGGGGSAKWGQGSREGGSSDPGRTNGIQRSLKPTTARIDDIIVITKLSVKCVCMMKQTKELATISFHEQQLSTTLPQNNPSKPKTNQHKCQNEIHRDCPRIHVWKKNIRASSTYRIWGKKKQQQTSREGWQENMQFNWSECLKSKRSLTLCLLCLTHARLKLKWSLMCLTHSIGLLHLTHELK